MSVAILLVGIAFAAALVFFARRRDDYSHVRQTIGELGERGSSCNESGRRFCLRDSPSRSGCRMAPDLMWE
jgi:hypothetical protein